MLAHRIMPGGMPVCRFHFEGALLAVGEVATEIKPAAAGQEDEMPKKIEIDIERFKKLHFQGLLGKAMAKEFGCSVSSVCKYRKQLGLKPNRGRGQTSVKAGEVARSGRDPARQAARASAGGTVTVRLSNAALDAIWKALSLEVKAEAIEGLGSLDA